MAYGNYAPFYRAGFFNPMQNAPMTPPENFNQFNPNYQQPPITPATQPIGTPTAQTPQMSNDMIWVQGLAGAKAYLVAPNTTVTLWDSESQTIYLKSCDSNGVPSMKILDIKERVENTQNSPVEHTCGCEGKYPKIEQFNDLSGKFDDILGRVESLEEKYKGLSVKTTPKPTKKVEE